jgi:hypothetical protein
VAAGPAAAILAAVLLVGCGGDDKREDVDAYIRDVNAIEQQLLIDLSHASAAYRDFTTHEKELVKLRPKLVAAERSMRRHDRRLGALQPPPEARRLHQLVRQLTRAQVELADELQRSAVYLPGYSEALRPLDAAQTRLRKDLGEARTASSQARAVRRFEGVVADALERLARLDVPAVMSGTHKTQSSTLELLRDSARDLATALERGGRPDEIRVLLERLVNAPLAARSLSSQKTRIAAVKAYNARVEHVQELARRVERERLRLERSLR